jgi:hypothetical protein
VSESDPPGAAATARRERAILPCSRLHWRVPPGEKEAIGQEVGVLAMASSWARARGDSELASFYWFIILK